MENASVDTRVKPRGKLVIWLMGHSPALFERINSYGLHAIQVHYANGWFGKFGKDSPGDDGKFLGKIRLEAATGENFSDVVDIPHPDGMMERAFQFVKWARQREPAGRLGHFSHADQRGLRWDRVIIAGSSHGSTTAAPFRQASARGSRGDVFAGRATSTRPGRPCPRPRPPTVTSASATSSMAAGRATTTAARGTAGLHQFGPIVDVDEAKPPYDNTRRLISHAM